ncbi:iron uptake transporter deferrochelatase/peroxidase subunit [Streptomyces sp. WMMB303]|uniref:iron uptake transporter deferrochelatase/peroxidase subunit n=1 Tax=Streptomyces sp. WMMB303 TaxID=3034154 RepID=UPI0023ED519E|nr:iron uptake transporter deferrochelatase/peroxidase subunit [Streptomyces sp. WMMB303]MDF4251625.1 iron uptake transporter deferrochelatase/peroxidase subunit [Streptomyces sp. WMMB303]
MSTQNTRKTPPTQRSQRTPEAPGAPDGADDGSNGDGAAGGQSREPRQSGRITRRRLLGTASAAGAAGLTAGAAGGAWAHSAAQDAPPTTLSSLGSTAVSFHGTHQAGIVAPAQAHGHLLAFDLAPRAGRKQAAALLRRWSEAARRMMAGEPPEGGERDTGIALDAGPSSLTVTFGFGRTFFSRTGLTDRLPAQLAPLPDFSADALDKKRSDGDLWVQIGADDALVAFHALRALQREAADTARVRWHMSGFNRSPGATEQPRTMRNLMGQVDGTNNPRPEEKDFDERIFVPSSGAPSWMAGGSYVVQRRIRMLLDAWDTHSLGDQEQVIGRRKSDGAPLSGGHERTEPDLDKRGPDGRPLIAADAHIRVTAPESNGGAAMLRRSFSFHDGFRGDGAPDAGLLFVAWQADPLRGFVPVQRKLDRGDALSRFLRHEASALFAVPGGPGKGEYVGQRLLEG